MLLQQENPHGGDIYSNKIVLDFSANVSPIGTSLAVKNAIINAVDMLVEYPDPFCRKLRSKLSEHHSVSSDYIICGNGAADIIFGFTQGLAPKKALIIAPTFSEYEKALRSVDCEVDFFILKQENDFEMTTEIIDNIKKEYQCVFLCNPNNPTGVLYNKQLLFDIAQHCNEQGIFFFIDECFIDLTDNAVENSLIGLIEKNSHLFILKAFTKSFGMAGVRLGYGISSNTSLLERISSVTQPWNVSTIAQEAGCAAIDDIQFVENVKTTIQSQREFLKKQIEKIGYTTYKSNANYIFFKAKKDLKEQLLKKGILIRSCENFIGLEKGFYRIAIKTKAENELLIKAINEMEV